jgi:D-3-phosphoglycerate dehydrogenase
MRLESDDFRSGDKNILFCTDGFPHATTILKRYLPNECRLQIIDGQKPLIDQVGEVEVLIPAMATITREIMEAAPKLKLIQQFGVGLEGVDIKAATELGIYVANVQGMNAISVAEHALFLMLALARKTPLASKAFQDRRIGEPVGLELYGKTLGIIGLGRSGTELAKMAKGLGMRVVAIKRVPDPELAGQLGLDFLGGPEDLDTILQKADFVSIHAPLTNETRKLIGAKELKRMKRNAYLINTARGPIVDKKALLRV